jgi:ferritin
MLSETLQKALNDQINAELFSSYLYLSMSMYFEDSSLAGAASWMKIQVQEEMWHADKLIGYIIERGGRVSLDAIDKPPPEWGSAVEAFEAAYQHELKVSALIGNLVSLARTEKDYMTDNFLQWFVAEQVEEESSVSEVVRKFSLAGSSGGGLLMIDNELGRRVFTPPAASVE